MKQNWLLETLNSAKSLSSNWYMFVTLSGFVVALELPVTVTSVESSEATTRNTSYTCLPFSGAVANCLPQVNTGGTCSIIGSQKSKVVGTLAHWCPDSIASGLLDATNNPVRSLELSMRNVSPSCSTRLGWIKALSDMLCGVGDMESCVSSYWAMMATADNERAFGRVE